MIRIVSLYILQTLVNNRFQTFKTYTCLFNFQQRKLTSKLKKETLKISNLSDKSPFRCNFRFNYKLWNLGLASKCKK